MISLKLSTLINSLLFDLYKSGIFTDSNGKVSSRVKTKLIEALGFNEFESLAEYSAETLEISCENVFVVAERHPALLTLLADWY